MGFLSGPERVQERCERGNMGLERARRFVGLVGHGRGWSGWWRHGKVPCEILNTPLGHTIPDTSNRWRVR